MRRHTSRVQVEEVTSSTCTLQLNALMVMAAYGQPGQVCHSESILVGHKAIAEPFFNSGVKNQVLSRKIVCHVEVSE